MKVLPYGVYKPILNFKGSTEDIVNDQTEKKALNKNNLSIAIGGIAGSLSIGALIYNASHGKKSVKTEEVNEILKTFGNEIKQFAKDINYRKALLTGMNIDPNDYVRLRPIIGPEEYKNIVVSFSSDAKYYSPGETLITTEKDGFNLSGKLNHTYRANLHMHTTHSDGKLSIKELLDKAAEYADETANYLSKTAYPRSKHAPFTIAITDHDSVEGCKEAVRIINENPEKYKNLRVVLGCELTVENKMIPEALKSPIPIHMLLHAINPFDENLNKFLNNTKVARVRLTNKMLKEAAEKMLPEFPNTAKKFHYGDAVPLSPVFQHRILHVDYALKDYLQFRTIYTECFENNPEVQKLLNGKSFGSYILPKTKFFDEITENFNGAYWKKYLVALQKYASEVLGITEESAREIVKTSPKLEHMLKELEKISNEASPKLDLDPAYANMEDAINLITNQEYGYMSIAHPGLTGIGDCLKNPSESLKAMNDLFKTFKEKGKDRAISTEIHYHYFGSAGASTNWLNSMRTYALQNNLLQGGGLDTHGKSIFYSYKDTP